jgi:hypothetical protein
MKRTVCDECTQEIRERPPLKVGDSRVTLLARGDWTNPKGDRDVCWECVRKELNKQAGMASCDG